MVKAIIMVKVEKISQKCNHFKVFNADGCIIVIFRIALMIRRRFIRRFCESLLFLFNVWKGRGGLRYFLMLRHYAIGERNECRIRSPKGSITESVPPRARARRVGIVIGDLWAGKTIAKIGPAQTTGPHYLRIRSAPQRVWEW